MTLGWEVGESQFQVKLSFNTLTKGSDSKVTAAQP